MSIVINIIKYALVGIVAFLLEYFFPQNSIVYGTLRIVVIVILFDLIFRFIDKVVKKERERD